MERAIYSSTVHRPRTITHLRTLLAQWLQNARTRRHLAQLNERELADVGINHCQRAAELSKPFWR